MGISKIYFADLIKPINKSALHGLSFRKRSKKGKKEQAQKSFVRRREEGKLIKAQNRASELRVRLYEQKVAAGEIVPQQAERFLPTPANDPKISFAMAIAKGMKRRAMD